MRTKCPNVKLFIAGSGILKSKLEDFVRENRLERNICFLGTIKDSDINEWYNKVSIVVIPSIFEGFGLNAIEAMAAGTPVCQRM